MAKNGIYKVNPGREAILSGHTYRAGKVLPEGDFESLEQAGIATCTEEVERKVNKPVSTSVIKVRGNK